MPEQTGRWPLPLAWGAIALWVLAYAVLKAQGLQGLDVDSAEQVYFAQSWQMGYGTRQPPLYTWLLLALKPEGWAWATMLEVARYTLLCLCMAGLQAFARVCGASAREQALVLMTHLGLSLMLWRVHDSLTHTVLAATLVTWASVAVVKSFAQPRWWLVAGALAALACLAKFNAGLWWVAALAVAWGLSLRVSDRGGRQCTWAWMVGGCLVFLAVLAPYGLWWLSQKMGATTLARQIAVAREQLPLWRPPVDVILGVLEFTLLGPALLAVIGVAAWRRLRRSPSSRPLWSLADRWVLGQALLALLVTVVLLMLARGSAFKARWLWPVAPVLTVTLVLWSDRAVRACAESGLGRWPGRALWAVALAMPLLAVGVSALRWWEPELNAQRCRECWTDRPASTLSSALHQRHGQALRVIAGDTHLAGILAAASPRVQAWAASSSALPPPRGFAQGPGVCVLAWVSLDATAVPPAALRAMQEAHGEGLGALASDAWPLRHAPQRRIWLHSLRVAPAACASASR
ncbi:MAG TPA: hypothetical protein VFW84_03005 [Aquabacterium sp.]|uniref:hypothetical protein n=1 Tax=Aquabacterium sp. TaxID=1872578 RepID=UPI002E34BBDF|nr:hypothetical protein [Aquabacterium sp.]HEX5371682.1 hypothetical protein [Aquabacterium sp.]